MFEQLDALSVILREEFGVTFRFFDAGTGLPLPDHLTDLEATRPPCQDPRVIIETAVCGVARALSNTRGRYQILIPIFDDDRVSLIASGAITAIARSAEEARVELARLVKWGGSVQERVRLALGTGSRPRERRNINARLTQAWQALTALEQTLTATRIDRDPERERRRILRAVAEAIGVETVVWVSSKTRTLPELNADACLSPWDAGQLAGQLYHEKDWETQGFLIRNNVAEEVWGKRFPGVRNVLTLPIVDRSPRGWLIAINKLTESHAAARRMSEEPPSGEPSAPFDRNDAVIMAAFGAALGMLVRSSDKYRQLNMLLVGLTRALTSTIDGKDRYTRGHSERVARIAVEIGRELNLQGIELSDLYLASLLHDIGKIAIRESLLHKTEPLTPEEFAEIQQHARIGHDILSGLPPIDHLLPAILHHHEHFDGSGYPDGLSGETIPRMARIIAVADAFDAMNTPRAYRPALPIERVEQTLTAGAGKQWDAEMVDALLRCRDRVRAIVLGDATPSQLRPDAFSASARRPGQDCLGLSFVPINDSSTRSVRTAK